MTASIFKACAIAAALLAFSGNALAAEYCAQPEEAEALKVAAMQQQLMVAALTCHETALYNRFVIAYREDLQRSDAALQSYFLRRDRREGIAHYHAYKTRLANDASLRSVHDIGDFCAQARAVFDVALERYDRPLAGLVSSQPAATDVGERECGQGPRLAGRP